MPSGFNLKGSKKENDSEVINKEFVEQQLGASIESINKLTEMFNQQLQFNQKVSQTLENLNKPEQQRQEEIKPPEDFDITQIHNPESDSGKYFQYLLSQRDKALEEKLLQRVEEKVKTENFEKEIQQGLNKVKEMYNLDDKTLEDFKGWVNNPEGTNLEVLYKVYETVNSKEEDHEPEPEPYRLANVPGEDEIKANEGFLGSLAGE